MQGYKISGAKMAAAALLALGFAHAPLAAAAPSAAVSFDWTSFAASTTDPSFAFLSDGSAYSQTTAFGVSSPQQSSSADWTTAISAVDGVSSSSASSTALNAAIQNVVSLASADVQRGQDFTLGAGQSVTFSVNYTESVASPQVSASASLSALDLSGTLGGGVTYVPTQTIANQTGAGTLSVTFSNTSNAAVTGLLIAEGTLSAVPEPATWATLAGGLLLTAGALRRRGA